MAERSEANRILSRSWVLYESLAYSVLVVPLLLWLLRVVARCRDISRGCVEVGQDHRGLEPRNLKSEEGQL